MPGQTVLKPAEIQHKADSRISAVISFFLEVVVACIDEFYFSAFFQ